jgi:hypothetical protein
MLRADAQVQTHQLPRSSCGGVSCSCWQPLMSMRTVVPNGICCHLNLKGALQAGLLGNHHRRCHMRCTRAAAALVAFC